MSADFRADFPLLAGNPALHYLDSAATAQIHRSALDAVHAHETGRRSNVLRGSHRLAEAADAAFDSARRSVARFVNAFSAEEVVFTSGATGAINLVAHAVGATLAPGDRILVSAAEHHSNFVPWQMLRDRTGVALDVLPVTREGALDLGALPDMVTGRTRLVAVTQCSNVTGAWTDVQRIVEAARPVGAHVLLDGAQAVQHGPQDVQGLGVDFYAFSGHKCFAPNGVGVLWGRRELLEALPPVLGGGGMIDQVTEQASVWAGLPRRFEAGTPPIAQAVGLAAALDWMMTLDWPSIREREMRLCERAIAGLRRMPGLRLLGSGLVDDRAPVLSFDIAGLHPHDVCQVLDGYGIALRGGHHCAQPLMAVLGVEACSRASFALYNDDSDVDALLAGLAKAVRILA